MNNINTMNAMVVVIENGLPTCIGFMEAIRNKGIENDLKGWWWSSDKGLINDPSESEEFIVKAQTIYDGGLKIYSAIDFDVQNAIEDVYENYRKMPDETVQGACVIMDYHGRILGMVGGTGKKKANRVLNRAWQSKRQPGSVIKPLAVYGPALEKTLQDGETNVYWSTPTVRRGEWRNQAMAKTCG